MKSGISLKVGQHHTIDDLIKKLVSSKYEREVTVSSPGQFSVSGGNISIFSVNSENPIMIEFFGSQIDTIFLYDEKSFNKIKNISSVLVSDNYFKVNDKVKINPGDYVVHDDHGVGIFTSLLTRSVEGNPEQYIVLSYLNEDKLYIPIDLKDKISPYIGVGRKRPRLNKLGTQTWGRTYKKTYESIILLAKELLQLYAKREIIKRSVWDVNHEWDSEIRKTFGYVETADQEKAISEIMKDIKKEIPLDRLICGDVGFGKTEVAIRIATQAIANGYQVAFLTPTTVLAEQHYITMKKRFESLPVRIEHLSRFVDSSHQKETVDKIKAGAVDLVIGTHRLLSSDIGFKNIGLLVIDEEQKFGVKDKEKLKNLRVALNVLSLTATPIPRTLFMALSGIRDLSQISSVPVGRKAIETEVSAYDETIIKLYIEREIKRGGQVYYLHNQVRTIEGARNKLAKMFPSLNIAVGHGQMGENALAKTMCDFTEGKIDILVCSTIIENGLDLQNANTLIVDDADRFGLSQLYQLRGRIGRSKKQAYALFTHKEKQITEAAFKRLEALVENTELGSGYNIALSDLEIRGGGNILGREQHGNMEAVGLVLYSKLLSQAVKQIKS